MIIPFTFLGNSGQEEQIQQMKEAVKKLPLAHYNCLKFMMEHLKR